MGGRGPQTFAVEYSCRRHGLINAPRANLSDMAGLVVGIVLSLWLSGYLLFLVLRQRGFGLTEMLGLLNVALAFLLALATVALAVIGYWQWQALKHTDETQLALTRAWVTPLSMVARSQPAEGTPFHVVFDYGNLGREPAINMGQRKSEKLVPVAGAELIEGPSEHLRQMIDDKGDPNVCEEAYKVRGKIIYPTQNNLQDELIFSPKDGIVTAESISGSKSIVIKGCFVYETIRTIYYSRYCFYYNSMVNPLLFPANMLSYCPSGNEVGEFKIGSGRSPTPPPSGPSP
jgi:hypothetical protein